jgi:hypothetical protein
MALNPSLTLSGVLGSIDNDVIVTTSSQFWNLAGSHFAEFGGLAHTAMPDVADLGARLSGTEDTSVTTSPVVVNCVANLLLGLSTLNCAGTSEFGKVPRIGRLTNMELALLEQQPTAFAHLPAGAAFPSMSAFAFAAPSWKRLGADLESVAPAALLLAVASPQDDQISKASPIPIPAETPEDAVERMRHQATIAPQRLSVSAPEGDVPLGNPVDIDVTFAPGQLADLDVLQSQPHDGIRGAIAGSHGTFRILREEGQTKTLEVVPLQLGPMDLQVGAVYSDNALAQQTVHLNVVPSAKDLKNFSLTGGAYRGLSAGQEEAVLVLGDEEKDRQFWMRPVVGYENVKLPIFLTDSTMIKLSVEQDEDNPVIRVDKNGMVHGLREGTAVIVGDFGGATAKLHMTVYDQDDAPAGYQVIKH